MIEKREKLLTHIAILIFFALVPYYLYSLWKGWNAILYVDLLNLIPIAGTFVFIWRKKFAWAAFLIFLIPLMNIYTYAEGINDEYGYYYNFIPIMIANFILFSKKEKVFPIIGGVLSILVLIFTNYEGWSPRLYEKFPGLSPEPFQIMVLNFSTALLSSVFGIKFIIAAYERTEKRLNESLQNIKELAETKTQFLSNMSHEIRTPMNAVIGMTNLLIEEDPRKDQLEHLNVLKFSADNLLNTLNDILDYSKLEAGKVIIKNKPFLLKETVTHVYKGFEPQAKNKGLQLKMEFDERIVHLLNGDMNRLVQVLNNLVHNAIKFTDSGSVTIQVEQQADDMVLFSVSDTGIGIPEEKIQTIFERFSQVNTDSNRKYGGTGLGLAISSKLLELQNSKLSVTSSLGIGSCFSFMLRLQPIVEINPAELTSPKIATNYSLSCNILLVEDNPINQLVAKNFIEKWGAKLDIAPNGIEAVRLVSMNMYDIILMDLQMPEMDGYEATRIIRQLPGEHFMSIPIIALTASTIDDVKEQFISAGMNNYMRKPFVPEELYQMIAHYIWQPRVIQMPTYRA